MPRPDEIEEAVEARERDRRGAGEEGADLGVVPVDVVSFASVAMGAVVVPGGRPMRLGGEPGADVLALGAGIEGVAPRIAPALAVRASRSGAPGMIARSRCVSAARFRASARSVLVTTRRSATATWRTPSVWASRLAVPCCASTTVTIPSSRKA